VAGDMYTGLTHACGGRGGRRTHTQTFESSCVVTHNKPRDVFLAVVDNLPLSVRRWAARVPWRGR
jgi:hypothetical protein